MQHGKREPDRVVRVGGRVFQLYKYYEPMCGEYILDYPDFELHPEYTEGGMPFVMAVQQRCRWGDSGDAAHPAPRECSGCVHFDQEPPGGAIGICLCEERREGTGDEQEEAQPDEGET